MPAYILNKNAQANGDHEVHDTSTGCSYLPNYENQVDLGYHNGCYEAVLYAKMQYSNHQINGCYYCCNACHTS